MGEISFLKRVAWRWCGVHFFPGTKGPFGGFLLPETDPLGPAGARVLIIVGYCFNFYLAALRTLEHVTSRVAAHSPTWCILHGLPCVQPLALPGGPCLLLALTPEPKC